MKPTRISRNLTGSVTRLNYSQCVKYHFDDFEQVYEERFERAYGFYRPYLRSVIYRYLNCNILRNGFARVRCAECSMHISSHFPASTDNSTSHDTRSGLWNSGSGYRLFRISVIL